MLVSNHGAGQLAGMQMKVYLAGFDVFRPDAIERGEYLKRLCDKHGLEGLYPMDNAVPEHLEGRDAACWIAEQNMAMIKRCDAVLANLSNFRGAEPDSGTAFEMGVAVALGIPVWAYFNEKEPLREQIATDSLGLCPEGYHVEDFGLPKNLMLACQWAGHSRGARRAVEELSAYLFRVREPVAV